MDENCQLETELSEIRIDKETPLYNEQRAELIYKIIKKEGVKSILDVGCGLGKITVSLAKKGINIEGIDISPSLISLAKKKAAENDVLVNFHCMELNKFKSEEKFDAVLFAGVLEHIEDDQKMMFDARKLLKKRGKIIITDKPAFNCLYMKRDKRLGHLRRYTKKSLKGKLKKAGYCDIKLKYHNFFLLFGTLYFKLSGKDEYPYRALNPVFNKILYWWYKYLENNFVFPIGDRIIAVAKNRTIDE